MLVCTMALVILSHHVLVRMGHERYERVTAVGYSCVVFGWMTVLSVRQPTSSISLLGYVRLPVNLAPFGSLIFTSVVVPQASFVGHLAGIVAGYAVAWGAFAWMNWWWTGALALATATAIATSLDATTDLFDFPAARRLRSMTLAGWQPAAPAPDRAGRSRGSEGSSEGRHRTPRTPTCENGTAMQSTSSPDTGYH